MDTASVLSATTSKARFTNLKVRPADLMYGYNSALGGFRNDYSRYEYLEGHLNECLKSCRASFVEDVKQYNRLLRFRVRGKSTRTSASGTSPIEPYWMDSARHLEYSVELEAVLWRHERGLFGHTMEIPMETEGDWPQLVSQAAAHAHRLFQTSPSRHFALVLAYKHTSKEIRVFCCHARGLASSKALRLDLEDHKSNIIQLFLSLLTWETTGNVGVIEWESNNLTYTQQVERLTAKMESEMLAECMGTLGVINYFNSCIDYSQLQVPATNNLFFEGARPWNVFQGSRTVLDEARVERYPVQRVSAFTGQSLAEAKDPKSLFQGIIGAMIGYRSLLEGGYQPQDINIQNVMLSKQA